MSKDKIKKAMTDGLLSQKSVAHCLLDAVTEEKLSSMPEFKMFYEIDQGLSFEDRVKLIIPDAIVLMGDCSDIPKCCTVGRWYIVQSVNENGQFVHSIWTKDPYAWLDKQFQLLMKSAGCPSLYRNPCDDGSFSAKYSRNQFGLDSTSSLAVYYP